MKAYEYPEAVSGELPFPFSVLPTLAAVASIVAGALVLLGWLLDVELLKRGIPGFVAMNPVTAVTFILAGSALWKCREPDYAAPSHLVKVLAVIVLLVGAIKSVGLISGWHPNVDELLFAAKLNPPGSAGPNRMAPNTALAFMFLGVSLFAVDLKAVRSSVCQVFALAVGVCALFSLTGYIYGVRQFYGLASFIPMAIHTALLFLLLAAGVFFTRTASPLSGVFATTEPRGVLARRLFPSVIVLVLLLGWLRLKGEALGWYSAPFGTAVFAITLSNCFVALIWWTIWTVGKAERERTAMNHALIESKVELQETLRETQLILNHVRELVCTVDNGGKMLTMSVAAEQILGSRPASFVGRPFTEIHAADDRSKVEAVLRAAHAGLTRGETTTRCVRNDGTLANVVWSLQHSMFHKRTFCVGREIGRSSDRSAWAEST